MAKTRYYFNNKLVDREWYNGALNLYAVDKEATCRSIESESDDNVASTSKAIVNVNEAPPGGEDNDVEEVPMTAIRNLIGALSPPFEKQLTKTDVKDGQGRLALRKEFVTLHLVPMFNDGEDLAAGIDVTVFDDEGREYDMTFKLWADKLYVLMKGWKKFYKANNLTRAGLFVTLWMFRHVVNHNLCFAITRGRRAGGQLSA